MIVAWRPSDAHQPPWPPERASASELTEPITSPWMDRMLLDALRGIGEDTSIGSSWMKSLIDLRSDPSWEYPRVPADDRVDAIAHSYRWYASPPDVRDVADAVRVQARDWRGRYRRDRSEYVYDSLLAPFSQFYQVTMPKTLSVGYNIPPRLRDQNEFFVGEERDLWCTRDIPRVRREPAFMVSPYFTDDWPFETTAQDLHQKKPMTEQTKTTAPNQPFPDKIIDAVHALQQTCRVHTIARDMLTANTNPAFVASTAAKIVSLRDALKVILDYVPPPVLSLDEQDMVTLLLSQSRAHNIELKRGPFMTASPWIIPRELDYVTNDKRRVRHAEFAARHQVLIDFAVGVDQGFTGEILSGTRVGSEFESGVRVGSAVWARRAEGFTS